ncbi:MAG: hypothetical protein GXY50_08830 [Syntrophomonadaceae bacterium]|nr:hypothetical protein [Syntrophomonadaceae bacterium]
MKPTGKVIVLLAVFLLISFLAFQHLSTVMARVEANHRLITGLEQRGEREKPDEMVKLRQERARLEERIPDQARNAEMIIVLTDLAARHHLQQLALKESRGESKIEAEGNFNIDIKTNTFIWHGRGSYSDLRAFLADLETNNRLVSISSLELTTSDALWNLTFQLNTFFN